MGTQGVSITVHASVSRHNSDQDLFDNDAWDELVARITALVNEPDYRDILAMIV